jgi:hypothetical protein
MCYEIKRKMQGENGILPVLQWSPRVQGVQYSMRKVSVRTFLTVALKFKEKTVYSLYSEYSGSTVGVQWEYGEYRSTVGVQWEYSALKKKKVSVQTYEVSWTFTTHFKVS